MTQETLADPDAPATTPVDTGQVPILAPAGGRSAADSLRRRLLGSPASEARWGWIACLAVTAVGGFLRFWRLDRPHALVFDETYYVKQAYSLLKVGYELRWNGDSTPPPDVQFAHGTPDVFLNQADFVVHPPVGKWMIAVGELIFGPSSAWGWRFSAALCGTLSILMLSRIARRLFGSTLLGVTAGLLLALDGHHFVHSRTGLLDIFVMFWALAAFGCLLIDRDIARRRLAGKVASGASLLRFGPGLGIRWWRIAAGVCLGLCTGTKWSGVYFLAGFGLMTVFWDIGARRAAGVRHWRSGALLRDGAGAALQMVPVALAVYLASWTGWFLSKNAYDRQWGVQHPSASFGWVPSALRGLWHYHAEAYQFHVTLRSPHPYKANPWSWLVMGRPTAFYFESPKLGHNGCTVTQCYQAITALGNPVIWWGATIALGALVFRWLLSRDWRAGAILAGLAAGYLPWFHYQERTIFNFYAVAFVPWVVLALTYALGLLLGPTAASPRRRRAGALAAGAVVLAAAMSFAWFYPILSAEVIPQTSWSDRMWLPSWI